jgi:hypothetical protein
MKKETIEVVLERAIRDWKARKVLELYGTVPWEGDLIEWRRNKDVLPEGGE